MNNYLLQKILCTSPIRRCPFNNLWNYKNYSAASTESKVSSVPKEEVATDQEDWITIYKFPYILTASRFARLRKYQYGITGITIPVTFGLEYNDLLFENSTLLVTSLGISLSITFTLFSVMLRRLIGFVYVDPKREKVKFGYLTFNGKREDIVVKYDDLMPFSETQKYSFQRVQTVGTYTDDTKYKLVVLGGIIRRDDFELLFGYR